MSEQQNLALDQEGSLKSTLRSVYRSASDAMDGQSLFRSEKTLNRRIAGAPRQRCRSLSRDALIFPIEFLLIIRAEIRSVESRSIAAISLPVFQVKLLSSDFRIAVIQYRDAANCALPGSPRRMLTVGRREVREFIWQIPVRLNLISCHPPIRK